MPAEVVDRWTRYGGPPARPAPGWALDVVWGPSPLWGANGIVVEGDGLYVTEVFGSEVARIDVGTGTGTEGGSGTGSAGGSGTGSEGGAGSDVGSFPALGAFAAVGDGVAAPDDGAFGPDGTFYATAPMVATVWARHPDGGARVLVDELAGINGITMDPARRRLFADEFRPGGRLWELDPAGDRPPRLLLDDLATPNALAVGPDGALYFPLVVPGEIWRYDLAEGTAALAFAGLANPTAVKFDSAGRLLTSEAGAGQVSRFDLRSGQREVVAQVAPGIDNLALGPGDRLFVSHFTDGRVAEVTSGERVLSPSGLVGPFGVAGLEGGEVLVADGLSVAVVGSTGVRRTHRLIADLPTLVVGIAAVGEDWWLVGARGQVFGCAEGRRPRSLVGGLDDPTSLAADGAGGALLVERGAGRVVRLGPDGQVTDAISGLERPQAAAQATDGTVWVTTGRGLLGLRGAEVVATVAELAGAQGVCVDADGLVLVADPRSRRIVGYLPGPGALDVVVADAPLGSPVTSVGLPHAFASLARDASAGVLVGANGDGSVRRLTRRPHR